MTVEAAWRTQLLQLLTVARLGAQFPDSVRWRSLLELLGREGPRGTPYVLPLSPVSGLPEPKALIKLHKLQFVARAFFEKYRQRPKSDARAFSIALAALELPPVSHTSAKLVRAGKVNRFVIVHERLERNATRFSLVVDQASGGHVKLDKAQQASLSEPFQKLLHRACDGSATEAWRALADAKGLTVLEVQRGQLGPFISGLWPVPKDAPLDVRALRAVLTKPDSAVLSVQLERLAPDVAKTTRLDPWVGEEPPVAGAQLAQERRLISTPDVEAAVKTVAGRTVLVRSR